MAIGPRCQMAATLTAKELLALLRSCNTPFHGLWDADVLIREVEENLGAEVIDIPVVYKGSNNYGLHLKLSDQRDIMARMARDDVNMPNFDGSPIHKQVPEVEFEGAVYNLLRSEPNILVSRLLYHRIPVQHAGPRLDLPRDIAGRHLFLFERVEGVNNVWLDLSREQRAHLLAQSARIRASLFHFNLPPDFAAVWLRERLFDRSPSGFPFLLLRHASSALHSSHPRSKRQSGT
ncbi:hypothetical protein B0T24DRAFT_191041 [Lasiosphaeria ovina]|uniref:Uncharacterized protein n=1 Tax=Lasiosphaeria ovina TaxID=92902 RepID=A0AAE0NF45_9PEZI|nr:hypothetical protein B0T24DRAFT_191041 [Lasiosphaeria ovina]